MLSLLHILKLHIRIIAVSVCLLVLVAFALFVAFTNNNAGADTDVVAMSSNNSFASVNAYQLSARDRVVMAKLRDGDLIRAYGKQDIFIIKITPTGNKYKRVILNPQIFNSYRHLKWENVKNVSSSVVHQFTTSNLIRQAGRPNAPVYKTTSNGDVGVKRQLVMNHSQFIAAGYTYDSIYAVNSLEIGERFYKTGANIYPKRNPVQSPVVEAVVEPVAQPVVSQGIEIEYATTRTNNFVQSVIARAQPGCDTRVFGLDNVIKNKFLVHNNLCVRFIYSQNARRKHATRTGLYITHPTNLIEVYLDRAKSMQHMKATFVHELCHAQQDYWFYRNHNSNGVRRHTTKSWISSEAGQSFIKLTGYYYNQHTAQWKLPLNSPYRRYYNKYPYELSADICAITVAPDVMRVKYSQTQVNWVLRDKRMQQWLHKYMFETTSSSAPQYRNI